MPLPAISRTARRPSLLLAPLLLLGACGDPVETAREAVIAELNKRGDYEIIDAALHGEGAVCGHYRMMGKWGEEGRPEAYIYRDGRAHLFASEEEVAVFCSETPAAAVQEHFGINLEGEGLEAIRQVAGDLDAISGALENYYKNHGNYPSTLQGLAALREKPEGRPKVSDYPEGGYLETIPQDPWGEPYQYKAPSWGGVKSPYQLWTQGADRAPGGSGPDTDISTEMLPFLKFALR